MLIPKKYLLSDGSIYWHSLYYDIVPNWMCNYSPPGGWYNYAYYSYKPHQYILHVYKEIKWFIQRGRRGYSDSDVWNWCHYMARINIGALRDLRDNRMGHPIGINNVQWGKKIQTMVDAFVAFERMDNLQHKTVADVQALEKQRRKGMHTYVRYFNNLWD